MLPSGSGAIGKRRRLVAGTAVGAGVTRVADTVFETGAAAGGAGGTGVGAVLIAGVGFGAGGTATGGTGAGVGAERIIVSGLGAGGIAAAGVVGATLALAEGARGTIIGAAGAAP